MLYIPISLDLLSLQVLTVVAIISFSLTGIYVFDKLELLRKKVKHFLNKKVHHFYTDLNKKTSQTL